MKVCLVTLMVAAFLGGTSTGAFGYSSKLSPHTNGFLQMYENAGDAALKRMLPVKNGSVQQQMPASMTKLESVNGVPMVEGFIRLADGCSPAEVEAAGVVVSSEIGDMLVAKMPVSEVERIAEMESVDYIDIARPVRLLNDVSREITHVDAVQSGEALDRSYTGEGVVVGIVDTGIDFNNINFKDDEGNSRVKRAYDSYGTYSSPDEIAKLTTDATGESHGTHVAGIAAGGFTANNYQGMAPDADLYLCGLGSNLYTTTIISQAEKIVSYAKEQGMPAVVNMSLGYTTGPHNGTDPVAQALDRLSGEGAIFVIASGNEGDLDLYINKKFENPSDEEQFKTICYSPNYYGCYGTLSGYCSSPTSVQFMVVDADNDNEIVYETDVIEFGEYGGDWDLNQNPDASGFYDYFSRNGSSLYATGYYEMGQFATYVQAQLMPKSTADDHYRLGVKFYGEQGDEFNMWSDANIVFVDNGDPEFTAGTTDCTVNDMATGDEGISVGAYTTKDTWYLIDGRQASITVDKYAMSSFSSYGIDMNGNWHPTIVAPGCMVASSINSYDNSFNQLYVVDQREIDGSTYTWGLLQGTSMAAPAVTGIIATWLQYDPTLTPDDVKQILAATAQKPEKYGTGISLQWGPNGVIDAYAGLQHMLTSGVNDVSKAQDVVLVYPNPTDGQFNVVAQGEDEVTLELYNTGGALVYSGKCAASGGCIDVDVRGLLPSGIYVLRVTGDRCNYNGKIVIR